MHALGLDVLPHLGREAVGHLVLLAHILGGVDADSALHQHVRLAHVGGRELEQVGLGGDVVNSSRESFGDLNTINIKLVYTVENIQQPQVLNLSVNRVR